VSESIHCFWSSVAQNISAKPHCDQTEIALRQPEKNRVEMYMTCVHQPPERVVFTYEDGKVTRLPREVFKFPNWITR